MVEPLSYAAVSGESLVEFSLAVVLRDAQHRHGCGLLAHGSKIPCLPLGDQSHSDEGVSTPVDLDHPVRSDEVGVDEQN